MSDLKDLEETELQLQHSQKAGEVSAMKAVIAEVQERMGFMFVRRRDDAAAALRDLDSALDAILRQNQKKLDEFIEESKRREYLKRKMFCK